MTVHCSTCGREIPPGQGHYSTPAGLFCVHCGLHAAIIPDLIEVTGQAEDDGDPAPFLEQGGKHNIIRRQS